MNNIEHQLTIPEDMANQRLDKVLANLLPQYSRSKLVEWLKQGDILLNGQSAQPKQKVVGLEHIHVATMLRPEEEHSGEAIDLDIVFEDEHLIVLNKPANLVVHPAAGHHQGTLLNGLLHHHPDQQLLPRAGIVHRLDKDTTGLMVVAKTIDAHTHLVRMLQARDIHRHYKAICQGYMIAGQSIKTEYGRHPVNRLKMAVLKHGKTAITHVRVAQRYQAHTLVDVKLETGRTHQIRVHLSYIKHPIVGDPLYGGRSKLPKGCHETLREQLQTFNRQALHAYRLGFEHPITGESLDFSVDMPDDMATLVQQLQEYSAC